MGARHGVLVVVFGGMVVGLQAILADVTQGETLAWLPPRSSRSPCSSRSGAASRYLSTSVRPRALRRRRHAAAFAERLREQVDLAGLEADIAGSWMVRFDRRRGRLDPPAESPGRGMTRRIRA
jgi:hypothetical protein